MIDLKGKQLYLDETNKEFTLQKLSKLEERKLEMLEENRLHSVNNHNSIVLKAF